MPALSAPSNSRRSAYLPPLSNCGKEMRLVSVTPTAKSVIYRYLCSDHHGLEFTVGDA